MRRLISVVVGFTLLSWLGGCSGGGGGDGNQGVISFTLSTFRQNEDGTLTVNPITLERVGGTAAVSVTITFTGGSATGGGVDYDSTPIVVSWAAGDTADKMVTVPVVDDNNDEQPFETADMVLTSPTGGAILGLAFAVLEINDDDIAGTVQFDSPTYAYNEDGSVATQVITVTRTGGMDGDISVTVTSSDVTANSDPLSVVEPVDYTPISFTAFFADQDTTPVQVPISIVDDLLPEINETLTVSLSNPTNGADLGAPSSADVTIIDNDFIQQLDNPGLELNGFFGTSVAKIGSRLAVGAPGNLMGAGQVYAVNVDFGTVHDTHDAPANTQSFGWSLASGGNTLGIGGQNRAWSFGGDQFLTDYSQRFGVSNADDGFGKTVLIHLGRLVVGAPDAMIGGSLEPSGRVYSYDEVNGGAFPVLEGAAENEFGSSLAVYGNDVLIGAPGNGGQALLFGGSPWALHNVIANPFPQASPTRFGQSVYTNPGNANIVVGAPDGDLFAPNDGQVHVFTGVSVQSIVPPGPIVVDGRFGANVLVTSTGRICVHQPGGAAGVGRVFVLDGAGVLVQTIDNPVPAPDSGFGSSMCEFDGALVVGSPRNPFLIQSGVVFIFKLL
jgi:hypothetical protein